MNSRILLFMVNLLIPCYSFAQQLLPAGAWQLSPSASASDEEQVMLLLTQDYFIQTTFYPDSFGLTIGGPYRIEGDQITIDLEFSSQTPDLVGQSLSYSWAMEGEPLVFRYHWDGEPGEAVFYRVDEFDSPLAGAWKIRARMRDGQIQDIHRTGPRKTVKLLTGTRFQWTAMNTETGEFSGCGGGTYTFGDGVYTEHIDYFSRDNTRVGMSLSFNGEVDGDDWHHSGKSSRGNPISEIWARQ